MLVLWIGGDKRTGTLVFILGNIGGYVGIHKSLGDLKDDEIINLSSSWWAILAPSLIGGILAVILYFLFLSGFLSSIVSETLLPKFVTDSTANTTHVIEDIELIMHQHGDSIQSYAKLLIWSFIAGFNQKYAVDIINSVRTKT